MEMATTCVERATRRTRGDDCQAPVLDTPSAAPGEAEGLGDNAARRGRLARICSRTLPLSNPPPSPHLQHRHSSRFLDCAPSHVLSGGLPLLLIFRRICDLYDCSALCLAFGSSWYLPHLHRKEFFWVLRQT
ncbi:hypothetical protein KC19_12G178300 [Ceratodon purpureus]|uniref:Uncharacterized protein n=1 Tax=Ceratodon purpureus TaxID=3225 RepID=A0A8T0GB17_CERPU|nr:hypothetical protein KC19_12G178300 [Ceratodon purpureus]